MCFIIEKGISLYIARVPCLSLNDPKQLFHLSINTMHRSLEPLERPRFMPETRSYMNENTGHISVQTEPAEQHGIPLDGQPSNARIDHQARDDFNIVARARLLQQREHSPIVLPLFLVLLTALV